jgi:hypothetical protein
LLFASAIALGIENKSAGDEQGRGGGQNDGKPPPAPQQRHGGRDALLNARAESSARHEFLPGSLDRPLLLNPAQAFRGATWALPQMFIAHACVLEREFPIEVGI